MKLKMHTSQRGLCATCREALIIEHDNGDIETRCHAWGAAEMIRIRRPVVRCSDYDAKFAQPRYELEKIAWVIRTDKSGKTIGFAPPSKDDDL